ncbi:uncharacterized protein N7446_000508 [Penicillium canescens]|uniref:Uncharacterized protein n=1 Tax=Penicillium canescens TaxID=5083 RepID=A0AAD6N4W5_PENCN|nr:uncharacterized protein N7446_000508 [Penicillium canescens]KAJ6030429.1 hypothetical protein N7460_010695 [Penicillium canescens]KAJ6060803.1 hypothetical protein N7444_002657 [Penicillium canescens]KAJ6077572.1 hypothetical protein N7446_000508 [Penicillium canescens]
MDINIQTNAARSQRFSLSLMFGSTRKRASCIPDLKGEPTCQERALYPVFDPQDPRHNPQAQSFSLHRQRSLNPSESRKHTQWAQSIPRRSFHRARSHLLALRSGILRRSAVEDDQLGGAAELRSFVSPVALRREREQQGLRPAAYNSSTQDDLGFGTEIYRTATPWPTLETHAVDVYQAHVTSDSPTPAPGPLTSIYDIPPTAIPTITVHQSPDLMPVVGTPLTDPAESPSSPNDSADYQLTGELIPSTGDMPAHLEDRLDGHASNTSPSLHDLTESPWGMAITTNQELDMLTHGLGDTQSAWAQQVMEDNGAQRDPMLNESEYLVVGQNMCGNREPESRQSSRSSRSTAPSIFRHLSAHTTRPGEHIRHYPSRVTGEQSTSTVTNHATVPISRQCSAEVEFAFPGIYQEMLEQWMREPRESQVALATERERTPSASQTQTRTDSAQCIVPQDDAYRNPPSYYEYDQDALILESPQTPSAIIDVSGMEELRPLNHSSPSFAEDLDRQHFDNGPLEPAHSPNTIDEVLSHEMPSTNVANAGSRQSFGLHMSPSSDIERPNLDLSRRTSYREPAFDHQNRSSLDWTSAAEQGRDISQSLYDSLEYPRLYADESTSPEYTSTEVTSMTSMSSDQWSPIGSEVIFPIPVGANGYYLVDGKSSTHYHDGGNQPLKSSRQATSDGNAHSRSSLDLNSSIQTREMTEVMYPSNMSVQLASHGAHGAGLDYDEDESEMYDIEYRGQPSHAHW